MGRVKDYRDGLRDWLKPRPHMPDDLVVVRNCEAEEAGDYRVMKHSEVVGDPNWEIMEDMVPSDLD